MFKDLATSKYWKKYKGWHNISLLYCFEVFIKMLKPFFLFMALHPNWNRACYWWLKSVFQFYQPVSGKVIYLTCIVPDFFCFAFWTESVLILKFSTKPKLLKKVKQDVIKIQRQYWFLYKKKIWNPSFVLKLWKTATILLAQKRSLVLNIV